MVLREVEQHTPRAVVLCFGTDAAEYRVELFEGYHADRPQMPDDARASVRRLARAVRRTWLDGGGARPTRRTTCSARTRHEIEAGGSCHVMTGDRDMFQCGSDQVTILYVRTGARGASRSTPPRSRRATASPRARPRLHRAARRSLRRHPRRERGSGRRPPRASCGRHGSLEGALEGCGTRDATECAAGAAWSSARSCCASRRSPRCGWSTSSGRATGPRTSPGRRRPRVRAGWSAWRRRLEPDSLQRPRPSPPAAGPQAILFDHMESASQCPTRYCA